MTCRSVLCTKKSQQCLGKYAKMCFSVTCFIDSNALVHFKQQAETCWGMNGSTSNTGGSPSHAYSFSSPSTCFPLYCIERPGYFTLFAKSSNVSSKAVSPAQCPQALTLVNWGFVFCRKKSTILCFLLCLGREKVGIGQIEYGTFPLQERGGRICESGT